MEDIGGAIFLGIGNLLGLDFSELIDEPSINSQMSQMEAPNILVVAILPEVCEYLYEYSNYTDIYPIQPWTSTQTKRFISRLMKIQYNHTIAVITDEHTSWRM